MIFVPTGYSLGGVSACALAQPACAACLAMLAHALRGTTAMPNIRKCSATRRSTAAAPTVRRTTVQPQRPPSRTVLFLRPVAHRTLTRLSLITGAGTLANGDGSRQPSAYELGYAEHQGKYTTGVIAKLSGK